MLHSPLPRVLVAGVEGGASPLVPPPCPSPSSHQRSVFDSTPFPESSSQVGKLLRFEERSKERHERLKQEGVGGGDTRSDLFQFRYGFVASLSSRLEKRRGLGSAFFFFFRRSNCATGLLYLLFNLFRAWVGWSSASSDDADLGIAG